MDKLDLKPCPFCGRDGETHGGGYAGCSARTVRECPLAIYTMTEAEWNRRAALPVEEQGPRPVDPELVRMGYAYFSCQMLIGQLRKLAESHARYWDRFEACLFCKNHIDKGHIEGCLLVESQKAVLRFDDEQKRITTASRPLEEGKGAPDPAKLNRTVLAVLWEWGPGTGHDGARFWGCHDEEKDGRYGEWPKMGLRPLGASRVTVTEGVGLDLIPQLPAKSGEEGKAVDRAG